MAEDGGAGLLGRSQVGEREAAPPSPGHITREALALVQAAEPGARDGGDGESSVLRHEAAEATPSPDRALRHGGSPSAADIGQPVRGALRTPASCPGTQ